MLRTDEQIQAAADDIADVQLGRRVIPRVQLPTPEEEEKKVQERGNTEFKSRKKYRNTKYLKFWKKY